MAAILEGWDYDTAVAAARATKNPRERKRLMQEADVLRDFRFAYNRLVLHGLCIHCGAKASPCHCQNDD